MGVESDAVAEGGVAADEGGGVQAQEVAGADVVAEDGAGLHEEERPRLGVRPDVGEGGEDRAGPKLGPADPGHGVDEGGEGGAAGAQTLDADAAEGVLPDGAEDGRVEGGALHAAEDGRVAGTVAEGGGVVVDEAEGQQPGLLGPPEDLAAEAAGAEDEDAAAHGVASRPASGSSSW